jgi:hypothetical protein
MRRTLGRGLLLVPILAAFFVADASAQRWKWDFGVYGGYSWFSPLLDEEDTNLPDDAGGAEVHWDAGWLAGVQLGYNFRPNIGIRLNTRYSDRPVVGSDIDTNDFVTSTNLWAASLDLLFRLRQPADEFAGMEMLPYLALGLGAKWMNPGLDEFTCNDVTEGESFACVPFRTGGPPGGVNSRGWAIGEKNSLMGLVGFGIDWRLGRSFALRTEINDQIYSPQVYQATPTASPFVYNLPNEDNQAKLVHEIAGTIGLHFLMGLAPVPVVAVAPPPPPPPVVAPPPPPPAPREESISVCVIDPTAPGGIRMQTATLVEGRDTFVVTGGNRTPIRSAVGNVTVATGADWYVRGQPLVMNVGTQRVQFTTYGSSQVVSGQDLAYLGTVNGFPVYADRDDVADVINELNELNRTRPGTDLGVILNDQKTLRTNLEDVRMFYVPVYGYGCVFQGVQRQEEVRKGGK